MDIIAHSKNIGTVLGTASVLAYVSGYLALRARPMHLARTLALRWLTRHMFSPGFALFLLPS